MVNPCRFYTYAYLREDRTPYYIGKGEKNRAYRKGKGEVNPPKDKSRVIFLKKNLTEEDAFRHEKYMIAVFGRKDLGTGVLRNRTNGGEGGSGRVVDEQQRNKIRQRQIELYEIYPDRNPMFNEEIKQKWYSTINSDEYKNKQLQSSKRRIEIYVDDILYLSINNASKKTGIVKWYLEEKLKYTNQIYLTEYYNWIENKNSTKSIVVEINGKKYNSIINAEKETGITKNYIKKCIGQNKKITKEEYLEYSNRFSPKKIEINGITYKSLKEASNITGHSIKYLKKVYIDKINSGNNKSKKVIIDGTEYKSIREASVKTGMSRSYITKNFFQKDT